jgi:hypothetical protein
LFYLNRLERVAPSKDPSQKNDHANGAAPLVNSHQSSKPRLTVF